METISHKSKKIVRSQVLSVLLLMFLLVNFTGCGEQKKEEQQDNDSDTSDLTSVQENNNTVAAYVSFIDNDTNKMSLDHAYTNEAILKLTAATAAMADEIDYNVQGDLDKVKEFADKITQDPFETTHANNIRKSADILTDVLQNMQQAKYPGLATDIAELRNAVASINPDVLTLDQKEAVKTFFGKAADLLEKMN